MSYSTLLISTFPSKNTLLSTFIRKPKMAFNLLMLSLVFTSMVPLLVFCTEFLVGGDVGWSIPPKNDTDIYNHWAAKNRFHVGDTVYFKYKIDSVLVVNKQDYENCSVSNPISKFADGHTIFEFKHFGFFYFISGRPSNCKSGQKMIIRVMVQSTVETPKISPPPKSDDGDETGHHGWDSDDFGPPGFSATTRLSVVSCFMTALVSMFVVLYVFM